MCKALMELMEPEIEASLAASRAEAENRFGQLVSMLAESGNIAVLKKVAVDANEREKYYKAYGIKAEREA